MLFIKCETTLDLNWSEKCVAVITKVAAQATTFSITVTKHFVPVITLLTQYDVNLLEQLKSGFKKTIN